MSAKNGAEKWSGKKKQYRPRSWKAYEEALQRRMDLEFWFTPEAIAKWRETERSGQRGRPTEYADVAIQLTLVMWILIKRGLRDAESFVNSLFRKMGFGLKAPDHTTLVRRMSRIAMPYFPKFREGSGRMIIILDSTGLKIVGEKEWMNHKYSGLRLTKVWVKAHYAIDQDGYIRAMSLTDAHASDDSQVPVLLNAIKEPIAKVIADGGYHASAFNRYFAGRVDPPSVLVPPSPHARVGTHHSKEENTHIEYIATKGRLRWNAKNQYGLRNRVENTFSRLKKLFSNTLRSRSRKNQLVELAISTLCLNHFFGLGRPMSSPAL